MGFKTSFYPSMIFIALVHNTDIQNALINDRYVAMFAGAK